MSFNVEHFSNPTNLTNIKRKTVTGKDEIFEAIDQILNRC